VSDDKPRGLPTVVVDPRAADAYQLALEQAADAAQERHPHDKRAEAVLWVPVRR